VPTKPGRRSTPEKFVSFTASCPSSGRALSQLARLFRRRHGDLNAWNKHQEIPESTNLYKSTGLRSILIRNARHLLPYKPEPSS
jgi:hypothetical protein